MPQVPIDIDALSPSDLRLIAVREMTRRNKIGAFRRGRRHSDEVRRKISQGLSQSWANRKAIRLDEAAWRNETTPSMIETAPQDEKNEM